MLLAMLLTAVDGRLTMLFLAFVLARAIRTPWLWGPALVAVATAMFVINPSTNPEVFVPVGAVGAAMATAVLLRIGLLAGVVMTFTAVVLVNMPLTYDLRPWYAGASVACLVAILVPTVYGLVVSVGGWRRLVRSDSVA